MALDVHNNDITQFYCVLEQLTIPTENSCYLLKPEVGSGGFNRFTGEHWDLYTGEFKLLQDLHYQRFPNTEEPKRYSISFQAFKSHIDDSQWTNPKLRRAGEGIVFFSNPAPVNSIWHKNIECNMVFLSFTRDWIKQLEQEIGLPPVIGQLLDEREKPMFHVPLTTDTRHSVRQMFNPPKEVEPVFIPAFLYSIAVNLFVQAAGGTAQRVHQQVKQHAIHPNDLNLLEQIKIQLINSYQEPPQVTDLVEQTGMSKSKLQRLFQAVYKTSVYQFIKNIRMEKAMDLLMQGYSVTEAGYDVGYSSIPNFSAAFKEHFDVQPGQVISR